VGAVVSQLLERPCDQGLDHAVTLPVNGTENERVRQVNTADLDILLRGVAQRDPEAFAALYDATRSRVYGMVARVLREAMTQPLAVHWRGFSPWPTAGR